MDAVNRPQKYGSLNRHEYRVEETEVSLIAINDDFGNPLFLGKAKVGTDLSLPRWQIQKIDYDANQGVSRVTWPQSPAGVFTSNFIFSWSSQTVLSISNITQDTEGVVTVATTGNLQDGDSFIITGVTGMTEVNFDGTNIYTAANVTPTTVTLSGVNTSGYTAYASGGSIEYGEVVSYTYG